MSNTKKDSRISPHDLCILVIIPSNNDIHLGEIEDATCLQMAQLGAYMNQDFHLHKLWHQEVQVSFTWQNLISCSSIKIKCTNIIQVNDIWVMIYIPLEPKPILKLQCFDLGMEELEELEWLGLGLANFKMVKFLDWCGIQRGCLVLELVLSISWIDHHGSVQSSTNNPIQHIPCTPESIDQQSAVLFDTETKSLLCIGHGSNQIHPSSRSEWSKCDDGRNLRRHRTSPPAISS